MITMVKLWLHTRYFLLRLIAGNLPVALNLKINGDIAMPSPVNGCMTGLVANCHLVGKKVSADELEVLSRWIHAAESNLR